jgi:uncharacterized protein (UPF0548 family)
VGSTRRPDLPTGYNIDRYGAKLGSGKAVYMAATEALRSWLMFELGWLSVFPLHTEIREGSVVAVVASHLGFRSVNVSRIVYVEESEKSCCFAYGTLAEHAETGEERFTVRWSAEDDSVWYEILAISKPRHFLAMLGYPFSRSLQRRFGRDSVAAMTTAIRKR